MTGRAGAWFGAGKLRLGLAAVGGLMLTVAPAFGQAPPPVAPPLAAGPRVFLPDFFKPFAPKTALDMINNIPGFRINDVDTSARGFGQALENVLINGRRTSGKNNDAVSALQRIAAENVQRIEILDGASLNIPGLSGQVANIVAKVKPLGGSWTWRPEIREGQKFAWGNGDVALQGAEGGLSWTLALDETYQRQGEAGPGFLYDGQGQLSERRSEADTNNVEEPIVSAAVTYETLAGSIANLNISFDPFHYVGTETSFRFPVGGGPEEQRFFTLGEITPHGEIGADYEFALGPGRLKLIALDRLSTDDQDARTLDYVAGDPGFTAQHFFLNARSGEEILRGEYSFGILGGDAQLAAEGAYNYYEQRSFFEDETSPGGPTMIEPLDDANARVEERRGEADLSWSRSFTPHISLQGSLGAEYSQISQTGQLGLTREFVRPKGFLAVVWKDGHDLDLSFKVSRKVGQLNFASFLASVNVQNNNASAGNPDLVPDQEWIYSLEANQKFGAWGALKLILEDHEIEDIVDLIPVGVDETATGNIPKARAYSGQLSGTVNFDPIGVEGMKLDFRFLLGHSSVKDPLTGEDREISSNLMSRADGTLRWDVPHTQWAFAYGWEDILNAKTYRLDEIDQNWEDPAITYVYAENKNIWGMKARFNFITLDKTHIDQRRIVWDMRRTGPLDFIEDKRRRLGPIYRLILSKTF